MASFQAQMRLYEASRTATTALEASSRAAIAQAFYEWDAGDLTNVTVRHRLEAIVRRAYRASAAVAREAAVQSSDLPTWSPDEVFNTDYLASLLQDIRANLRSVKNGTLTREQAISRMSHTAGVAAQRGHTDQTISAYSELEGFGFKLRKFWVANFIDNDPCRACRRLHGTEVGLHEFFHAEEGESGVYRDLIGPPRHPRCRCRLLIFTVSLENAFEQPDFEAPQPEAAMVSTDDVKAMSKGLFSAVRATLAAVVAFFRRKK